MRTFNITGLSGMCCAGLAAGPTQEKQFAPAALAASGPGSGAGPARAIARANRGGPVQVPSWRLGDPIKLMALCRARRFEEARAIFSQAIESVQKDNNEVASSYKSLILWAIALELERHAETRDLALSAYGASLLDPGAYVDYRLVDTAVRLPVRALAPLAVRLGKRAEARRVLLASLPALRRSDRYAETLSRIVAMLGVDMVGESLVELGFAADAVPVFREAQILSERVDPTYAPASLPWLADMPRRIERT